MITRTDSPPLSAIISELNHESVNLYAEHLVKELGKVANGEGSTSSGIKVIKQFLDSTGVRSSGMFIEDGSGLSPQDAINSAGLTELLFRMRKNGKYFKEYFNSIPGPGKEGTIKNHFNDQVFESSLRAKSGSMLRVRSYAGFINAKSGKNLIFSIIINNYSGPSSAIISHIEEILKETILDN
jgi:D-alanyl-D-alanine carboxypeptidase/D-alanyl-D-alanine-endopeptidase (penicillin-binding protein 4)